MPRYLTCHYSIITRTETVPFYETDTVDDLTRRIQGTGTYPPLVFLPLSFVLSGFLQDSTAYPILDLAALFGDSTVSPQTTAATLPGVFSTVKSEYKMGLATFLEEWIFYELYVKFKNPDMSLSNVAGSYLLLLKNLLTMDYLKRFESPLVDPVTGLRYNRRAFLDRITKEWYVTKRDNFIARIEELGKGNMKSGDTGNLFEGTVPLPASNLEEIGKIIILEVPTDSWTTGIIFDRLVLNEELCVAQYKNFYKSYAPQAIDPASFVEKVSDFYSTSIYTMDGKLTVYAQNIPTGIRVQSILTKNTFLSTAQVVFDFLNLPLENSTETSAGLMAEFYVDNPSPYAPGIPWSALQAPLFANLAMNHPDFSKFISINDTDKISRQNNSLYLYFYDPVPTASTEAIYVSGWNRLASRFGDLTAILTPVQFQAGDYKVHVRITRSTHPQVIEKFVYFLTRLLRMYNEEFTPQLELFQSMVPKYQPVFQEPSGSTPTLSTLSTLDPILFPSNVYSRSCQNPNPVVITAEGAAALPEERKLLFPPEEKGGVVPRWFTCPTAPYEKDNKVYAYPGLKRLKKVAHPFHAAPCCYIKPHDDKNKKQVEAIVHPPPEKPDKIVYMPKIRPLETQKIINHVGQLGRLPPAMEDFIKVLHPLVDFYRVGTPTHWEEEPILAALEYYYGIREKKQFFRSPRVLRALLLEEPLQITLQQNYDIGVEGVAKILREGEYMDPTRFYKLLENFYRVNLFILTRDKDQNIQILRPQFIQSYYWNLVRSRPTVFIYQHYGGSADSSDEDVHAQCELIGYMTKKKELHFDFTTDARIQQLFQLAMATFHGNVLNTPLFLPRGHPMLAALDSQIVDGLGKTRVLLFTEARYVGVLLTPMAPLLLPSLSKNKMLPRFQDVFDFLEACQVPIVHLQEYQQQYLFLHVHVFSPMVFVTRYSVVVDLDVELLDTKPSFLQYILPETESILSDMNWNQRFASILQDYLVILLSEFLHLQKELVTTKSIPEIVDSFLQEKTMYQSGYQVPDASSVIPLVHGNPRLFQDEKLVLPLSFQRKMPFFLQWWMTSKSKDMQRMRDYRELPSYFQFTEDFTRFPFHIVQNTLTNLTTQTSYESYIKTPLAYLSFPFFKLYLTPQKIYYYYNVQETPEAHPYILIVSQNSSPLLQMGYRYLVEKKGWEAGGKSLESYWEKSNSTGSWKKHGSGPYLMALFHDVKYSFYYGLFPFTSV